MTHTWREGVERCRFSHSLAKLEILQSDRFIFGAFDLGFQVSFCLNSG